MNSRVTQIVPEAAQAEQLAMIHAACFEPDAQWNALRFLEFASAGQGAIVSDLADTVLVMQLVADEAEVLTLAVRPTARNAGKGRAIMEAGLSLARASGAERVFLEVAVDNGAALALYRRLQFVEISRRKRYYRRRDGSRCDASVMALDL